MRLSELLNVFSLALGLFITILIFNFLLYRTVKNPIRSLLFKLGIFLLFSLLTLSTPPLFKFLDIRSLSFDFRAAIACIWWFSLGFLINETLTYFFWEKLLPGKGITVSRLLRDLIAFVLMIMTIACIFYFVFDKSVVGLFTASGIMAIILGYSAQATLGEAFAGVGLNIIKQFDKDDWIELFGSQGLPGSRGKVVELNWRFVNLLTLDGNYLSIPNSQISKEKIINLSRPSPIHGVTINVPIENAFSPEKAKNLLVSSARQCSKISTNPPPTASLIELQTSGYHSYQLNYHTAEQNVALVTDQVLSIFSYQCQRHKLAAIHTPSTTSYTVEDIQTFLEKMDLFSSLDKKEITHLATESTQLFYGPPERILIQGENKKSLFLIYTGSVNIYIKTPDAQEIKVAALPAGHYFGEMSLLTGDAAAASVVVNTESTIIEITYASMAALFTQRPELVEKISEVIVQRKLSNDNVQATLRSNKKETHSLISELANRIKHFFKPSPTKQENDG